MEGKIVITVEQVKPTAPGEPDIAVNADVHLRNYNPACAAPIIHALLDALGVTGSLRTMMLLRLAAGGLSPKRSEDVTVAIPARSDPDE